MDTLDKFRNIRPLNDKEVEVAVRQIAENDMIKKGLDFLDLGLSFDYIKNCLSECHSVYDFKKNIGYNLVAGIVRKSCFSLEASGRSKLDKNKGYTFISNHRDIILDSAFVNTLLFDYGCKMPEIAIGDNLLIYPWIETLVKLNGSFIVRRNLSGRDVLTAAKELSQYMHTNIGLNKSQWIAQREGRAKDSNDRTQHALLKMLSLGADRNMSVLDAIRSLNIIPTSCSYEFDPCDALKAKEMQLKRDDKSYKKTPDDDGLNMITGLKGYKGRVHITFGRPLNELLNEQNIEWDSLDKNQQIEEIANVIDKEIYSGYRIYPNNYVALDLLDGDGKYENNYSEKEKSAFLQYLDAKINQISFNGGIVKDCDFLKTMIITMYANPLKNKLALNSKI